MKTGDLIFLRKNEQIPADMILVSSSRPNGQAFIQTSNLDGEKNYKPRFSPKEILKNEKKIQLENLEFKSGISKLRVDLEACFFVRDPHPSLYRFEGYMKTSKNGKIQEKKFPLNQKNFLFKGSRLRNVDWVIGVVGYIGKNTKL